MSLLRFHVDEASFVRLQVGDKFFKVSKKDVREQFKFDDFKDYDITLRYRLEHNDYYAKHGGHEFTYNEAQKVNSTIYRVLTIKEVT
jgi:hypothetical protein